MDEHTGTQTLKNQSILIIRHGIRLGGEQGPELSDCFSIAKLLLPSFTLRVLLDQKNKPIPEA
jgi:hypothetical protein